MVLEGKTAVVTGAATGIGEAIARRFAAAGATVVVADLDGGGASRVAEEIGGRSFAVDVADEARVIDLFAACDTAFDGLDALVNNAGIVPEKAPVETLDGDFWDRVMGVNARGVMLCTKHAVPRLRRRGGGSVVNMSSCLGVHGTAGHSLYCATKFAVRGLTESAALELGVDNIRVNSLCPGTVGTANWQVRMEARARAAGRDMETMVREDYAAPAALGRILRPEEVADAALFLASDEAAAITGSHLAIDAGRPVPVISRRPAPARAPAPPAPAPGGRPPRRRRCRARIAAASRRSPRGRRGTRPRRPGRSTGARSR